MHPVSTRPTLGTIGHTVKTRPCKLTNHTPPGQDQRGFLAENRDGCHCSYVSEAPQACGNQAAENVEVGNPTSGLLPGGLLAPVWTTKTVVDVVVFWLTIVRVLVIIREQGPFNILLLSLHSQALPCTFVGKAQGSSDGAAAAFLSADGSASDRSIVYDTGRVETRYPSVRHVPRSSFVFNLLLVGITVRKLYQVLILSLAFNGP